MEPLEKIAVRKANVSDIPEITSLFTAALHLVCCKDYTPAQIAVWSKTAHKRERWYKALTEQYFITAREGEKLVGFASLVPAEGYIDFMYVSPSCQGRGIGYLLYKTLRKKAQQSGLEEWSSDVSLTARPFFERRGFEVLRKNEHHLEGEVLVNFRMKQRI